MSNVIVFPGQGAQRSGMAAEFVERFAEARAVFDQASAALDLDLAAICFGPSDDARLHLTEYTQPCILTAEIAMLAGLRAGFGVEAARFGGHSLGEYTALVAAGALPLVAAVRLVRLRGRLMQEAVPVGEGAMLAVLQPGLDVAEVTAAAARHDVDVANLNSPSQVVLSGRVSGIAAARAELEPLVEARGGRVVPLEVSAPFHSRLMRAIEPAFRDALDQAEWDAPRAKMVTSNFTGGFHAGERGPLIDALVSQISGAVRWTDNMRELADGAARVVEVGPNRPLGRFFKELGCEVPAILNLRGAEKVFGEPRR